MSDEEMHDLLLDKSINRAIAEGKIASKYEVSSLSTIRKNGAVKFTITIYLLDGRNIRYRM